MTVNILSQNKFYNEHLKLKRALLSNGFAVKDFGPYTPEHITTFDTINDYYNNPFKRISSDLLLVLESMVFNYDNTGKFPDFEGEMCLILSDSIELTSFLESDITKNSNITVIQSTKPSSINYNNLDELVQFIKDEIKLYRD